MKEVKPEQAGCMTLLKIAGTFYVVITVIGLILGSLGVVLFNNDGEVPERININTYYSGDMNCEDFSSSWMVMEMPANGEINWLF